MKLTPKLALIGLVVAAVVVIASALVPLLGEDDHQNADGRVMALKEGLHSIEVGVRHWAAAHDSDCPPASRVSGEGLGMLRGDQTIPAWPANPYTGQPMAQGGLPATSSMSEAQTAARFG